MNDQREQRVMPTVIGLPADDDIFTDNVRFGDMDAWNRAALRIHEEHDGLYRIEREGFPRILAVRSRIRCGSTSSARMPTVRSRSGSASTSVWVPNSLAWSCGRSSTGWCH